MSHGDSPTMAAENGSPVDSKPDAATNPAAAAPPPEEPKHVQEVLSSEIGVSTMLNRVKQSIASIKEFATFLRKRAMLEQDHADGLRKLCRNASHDSVSRGGTFGKAYEDMMAIHEHMADNGMRFAQELLRMYEDLHELAAMAEKLRKGGKQQGLGPEQRLAELESAMRKSKGKYDSLADDYERVRTGDSGGPKRSFGFKGPKSAAQHEDDLLKKVQGADHDYHSKVATLQTERSRVISTTRPETVKALQEVRRESDAALVVQLQKFSIENERFLLNNGLCVKPLNCTGDESAKSLRDCIASIDNEKDFVEYLGSCHVTLPRRTGEPQYRRNPVLDQQQRVPPPGASVNVMSAANPPTYSQQQRRAQQQQPDSLPINPPISVGRPMSTMFPLQGSMDGHGSGFGGPWQPGNAAAPGRPSRERSSSHGNLMTYNGPTTYGGQPSDGRRPPSSGGILPPATQPEPPSLAPAPQPVIPPGPPQLAALSFQIPPLDRRSPSPSSAAAAAAGPPAYELDRASPLHISPPSQLQPTSPAVHSPLGPGLSPVKAGGGGDGGVPSPTKSTVPNPVFGVSLQNLYQRDMLAVPMVVYQCIQAVDLYGLVVEGIYRLSGSVPNVNTLKHRFDTVSTSPSLDFREPENFFHDVNGVAGLLKHFFRDLPDPLLTNERYADFIEAAKRDDDIVRRDSMHAIINELPDPNYATLRALTFHLHRVVEHSSENRMSSQNLAIVFGPTLMGTSPSSSITDAGWQVRVIDTIIQNAYQIFMDD